MVGIAADVVTGYGRAVMRGAMRYANIQRSWLIHEEMRRLATAGNTWPKCDGAIVAGVTRDTFQQIRRKTKHVIFCSGSADPDESGVVSMNDHSVGVLAAEHLLECRLDCFAFYQRAETALVDRRFAGFSATLEAKAKTCAKCPVPWHPEQVNREYSAKVIQWLVGLPKPAGIMAVDDSAAHNLAGYCLQAGIAVPEQIAIVGVNNDELLCQTAWPPLSSVDCDFERVGYLAAQLLDRLLRGEKLTGTDRVIQVPPLGIARRQSSDMLAIDDPNLADALRFIREHACDPCSVQDVLREVPVARRWLERQFLGRLGRTPHDEITKVQMEEARRLLVQPGVTIADVASRCGFSSLASFGRAFLRSQEMSPAAYRKSVTKSKQSGGS